MATGCLYLLQIQRTLMGQGRDDVNRCTFCSQRNARLLDQVNQLWRKWRQSVSVDVLKNKVDAIHHGRRTRRGDSRRIQSLLNFQAKFCFECSGCPKSGRSKIGLAQTPDCLIFKSSFFSHIFVHNVSEIRTRVKCLKFRLFCTDFRHPMCLKSKQKSSDITEVQIWYI